MMREPQKGDKAETMTFTLFLTQSILLCFVEKVNRNFWKNWRISFDIIMEMSMSFMDFLRRIYITNASRMRRLWHHNDFSADILGLFDLRKILSRVLSFHKVFGLRRLLELLSFSRLLAFSER